MRGSRGQSPPCGVKRQRLLWGQGAKPLEGSAGNHNSIQIRRCARETKGTALSVFLLSNGDNYSQRRQLLMSPVGTGIAGCKAPERIPCGFAESQRYSAAPHPKGFGGDRKAPETGRASILRPTQSSERETPAVVCYAWKVIKSVLAARSQAALCG